MLPNLTAQSWILHLSHIPPGYPAVCYYVKNYFLGKSVCKKTLGLVHLSVNFQKEIYFEFRNLEI